MFDPALAHLDHSPKHGGLVLMNEDTHFEVVVNADGACRVYFTDAVRKPLPPAYASQVTVGLVGGAERRTSVLRLDRDANVWVGQLGPAADPTAVVRVFYEAAGERP